MADNNSRKLLGEVAQARFRRFEIFVLGAGSAAIAVTAVASYLSSGSLLELIGQLLMLIVLLISFQYGRKGALISSLAVTAVYTIARTPELGDEVVSVTALQLVGIRAIGYFIVGIIGGELMGAVKYYFAREGGLGGVDPGSGVYVAEFIKGMIEKAISSFERYSTPFSVVTVEITTQALRKGGRFGKDRTCKGIGSTLKENVRIIDEIGRLDDFLFVILLPHTPITGAEVVADRVAKAVARQLCVPVESGVTAAAFGAPDHLLEIKELIGLLPKRSPAGVPVRGLPSRA